MKFKCHQFSRCSLLPFQGGFNTQHSTSSSSATPQEAWKQQQLARYWSRQALEDEAATMRSLPPPKAGSILSGKKRAVPVMVAYDFDIQTYENHICKGGLAL